MISAKASNSIFFSVLLCLFFVATPQAHAQFFMGGKHKEGREGMKEKMEQRVQEIYAKLDLSDEQRRLLEENKAKHKASKESLSKELGTAMQQMGDELKKEELDLAKINALQGELKRLRNTMMDERFNAVLEVRKILTQPQFAKFVQLMEEQRSMKESP